MKLERIVMDIENVLLNEVDNPNSVYMYLEGDAWCAYERSAYYLAEKISSVVLKKEVIGDGYDVVLLKAFFGMDEMYSLPSSSGIAIKSLADDKIQFCLDKKVDGFPEWKRKQLEKLSA
ncbi:hypothetical protein LJC57_06485 [Parabacteroides sp. OttesenSCG-928-G07]|nr:hypothetical protein [Parabacteroides sp. OttesenSCG-928-G07]